ncbi:MAG: hypothetical protein IPK70_00035 [Flavobacteriales bacterium]|nr:hypothetical protein [Flavobacteriales bacterium]MBK8225544.1 hypothetical protein [Flavobacteriales bacterium]
MDKSLSLGSWFRTETAYFFRNFFRPWRIFTDVTFTDGSVEADNPTIEAVSDGSSVLASVVQKAVCYNQGALIEFAYMSAERHKAMRIAYDNEDVEEVRNCYKTLVDHQNAAMREIALHNFQSLAEYFALRSIGAQPRICLKGNSTVESNETIIRLFGDADVKYKSNTRIENNTGHLRIKETGTFFLENDIPTAAARGEYKNPRLDPEKAKEFVEGRIRRWKDCWDANGEGDSAYYRSTLIVPLTLWNNQLSPEFKSMVKNFENVDRAIFGYLCFDHVDTNYFTEQDAKVGYMYADLLSVFMFVRMMYTEMSDTYKKTTKVVNEADPEVIFKPMPQAWKRKSTEDVGRELMTDPIAIETTNNRLITVDEQFQEYVGAEIEA